MKTVTVTTEMLRALVGETREPAEPWETIADVLDENAGKKFTTRYVDKVLERVPDREAVGRVWVTREWGYTHLNVQMPGTMWENRSSVVVGPHKYCTCPTRAELEERNPAHYEGRRSREEQRDALTDAELAKLADAMNRTRAAFEDLKAALSYGAPADVIRYPALRLWGWEAGTGGL